MRYVSSAAQEALRAEARAFLAEASPPSGGPPADGDRRGLRPGGLGRDRGPGLAVAARRRPGRGAGGGGRRPPVRAPAGDGRGPGCRRRGLGPGRHRGPGRGRGLGPVGVRGRDPGRGDPVRPPAAAWLLDGHKSFVVDGWVADTLLVAGRTATDGARRPVRGGRGRPRRGPHPPGDRRPHPPADPGGASRARPVGWSATRAPSTGCSTWPPPCWPRSRWAGPAGVWR